MDWAVYDLYTAKVKRLAANTVLLSMLAIRVAIRGVRQLW